MVRVGDLNAGDPGSNPELRLPNGLVLVDPLVKFATLCKQKTGVPPSGWREWDFNMALKNPFRGSVIIFKGHILEDFFRLICQPREIKFIVLYCIYIYLFILSSYYNCRL